MTIRETVTFSPRTTSYHDLGILKDGRGSLIENAVTRVEKNSIKKIVIVHPTGTPGYSSYLSKHLLLPENSYRLYIEEDSGTYYIGAFTRRQEFGAFTRIHTRTGNAIELGYDKLPELNTAGDFAAMDRELAREVLKELKSQKVNVAQAIAERSQVIRMVGDTAMKIAAAISAVKKGNLLGAARELGAKKPGRASRKRVRKWKDAGMNAAEFTSRSWLELQYGWKPLLQDVHGAAEALAYSHEKLKIHRVHVTKRKEFSQASPVEKMSVDGKLTGSSKCNTRRISSMTLFFSINESTKPLVALGLTNPAAIAWEVLPWSFVVDWFIPVGDWVGSFDATLGSSFIQGSHSILEESKVRYSTTNRGYASETFTSVRETRSLRFTRDKMLTFPGLPLPEFKNPVSVGHAANAIALLVQSFRK